MRVLIFTLFTFLFTVIKSNHTNYSHADQYILNNQPIVVTKYGSIRGVHQLVESSTVFTFRSIPYAKPPINDLRFKNAEPPEPWPVNPLDGSNWPAQCMQADRSKLWTESDISFQPLNNSEDCLYLNIFVPTCEGKFCGKKLPVFVYIHGGSFISLSSSSTKLYDGKILASLGKIIVVTLNYRLGLFGFLYANHDDSPGNQALTDVQMALLWVKQNIAQFGGDPSQVTVGGESAGSIMATIEYLNQPFEDGQDSHKPWIKRWIFSSGLPIAGFYESKSASLKRFQTLIDWIGCNKSLSIKDQIACVRGVNSTDLIDAQLAVAMIIKGSNPVPIQALPTVGVKPFEKTINQQLNSGKLFHKTQILMTNMFAEGSLFFPSLNFSQNSNDLTFERLLQQNVQLFKLNNISNNLTKLGNLYHTNEYYTKYWQSFALIQMLGDRFFNCPSLFIGDELTLKGVKVHQALFAYCNSDEDEPGPEFFNGCTFGAHHGGDIKSTFGIPMIHEANYAIVDRIFARKVINVFSSFVRGEQLPWPAISDYFGLIVNYEYQLDLSESFYTNPMRINPRQLICESWAPFIWPYYSARKVDQCKPKNKPIEPLILPEDTFDIEDMFG